ncbi:GyrI-like domain-containing protein [Enterobacter sp. RHBSTW-00994]|uniref:GyrI-like domain-containing protein n=1 Tax=Enterobacteriaceae TaxID=543 RepID=UPI0015EA71BB|nr:MULTISPECIES: GyrI-like domain-containing protein [Enterobacteriaceae]MBM3073309.1 DNA gyrase inhibitor [Lelliottia sp. RWM.1]QLR44294.1 GyrI-like domain-containing protein [Enterobacter sp. RHBSTW-00994]
MSLRFEDAQPRQVVCLRVGGPWNETVPKGFSDILSWAKGQNLSYDEALVFYWDDPAETDADALRADVALTMDPQTVLSTDGTTLRQETVPAGLYAVWHAVVSDGAYAKAWNDLYAAVEESEYVLSRGVCFEKYLCDGRDGNWDIEIWQSVEPK